MTAMNGKGKNSSKIAVAIATSIAVGGSVTPSQVHAKPANSTATSSNVDAIIGTGKDAIIGTGKDAIIGTGKDAIIGTGKDAIIGTGADAIIGTGKDAIIGTGKDAIIGTGADAIIGTGRVLLFGPIDSVNTEKKTISMLGRTLKLPSVDLISEAMTGGMQLVAAVSGQLSSAGKLEKISLRLADASYVPGASKVVISGRVDKIDDKLGTMKVGRALIDVTSVRAAKSASVGDVVVVMGTQPTRQGVVIAEQMLVD
jgi:hypothetical protein